MANYRDILNRQGLNILKKPVQIPDSRLMIGHAEDLTPQPIVTYADYMPANVSALLPKTSDLSYEDVQGLLANGQLTIDDFFEGVYPLGDAVVR